MSAKVCGRCKVEKPLAEFNRNRSRPDGYQWTCKTCQARDTRASDARHREKRAATGAEWKLRNPEKVADSHVKSRSATPARKRAHDVVYKALRSGRLVRPDACADCGREGRIEAHHADYDRPLDVRWLCHPCHSQTHVRIRGTA